MCAIKAVVFDFDGTLSTLRAGWEEVMAPFMKEAILGNVRLPDEAEQALDDEIAAYIDQSTGIQTVFQMRWLAETVRTKGWNPQVEDEWTYKAEYNRRLLERVRTKVDRLKAGELKPADYLMAGAAAFVRLLHEQGIRLFMASGTDHADVVREAEALGVAAYFDEIAGAPEGKADCAKEKVMRVLLQTKGFDGAELAVIGDGKVEIALGKEAGAVALGLASDEECREGINPIKEKRLQTAGADWITGDFSRADEWLARLGLR